MKKIVKLLNCSDCSITRTYNHLFHKQTLNLNIKETPSLQEVQYLNTKGKQWGPNPQPLSL